jgi:hypothetical protein
LKQSSNEDTFLAYCPLFWNNKSMLMRSPCCLCIPPNLLFNA